MSNRNPKDPMLTAVSGILAALLLLSMGITFTHLI
ncbi:hypothetical protein Sulac_2257 [Sulfobacillus acidophilus DSM 10332]|uniref:Uncharacterized protein n=1 Tax=Sulfobacillus acidophilus (strain ATCC 700253 / DSM 10332 / NAL) TaxID=679936 RepID=G8TU58_SULAD|nr:hypothetical protein Sulac_2257 [Sulfobacillus acidophilus DSM 10332]